MVAIVLPITIPMPRTASAVEPPRSEAWLLSNSDIVVEGSVVGVIREALESRESSRFPVFRAWLVVDNVLKGDFPVGRTVEVFFRKRVSVPTVAGLTDATYLPGERVRAFLIWGFEGKEGWTSSHWSGKQTLEPSNRKLPEVIGESVVLDTSAAHQPGCETQSGRWLPLYKIDRYRICVLPTSDAGHACTDSEQCEGLCLSLRELALPGEATKGACSNFAPIGGGCRNEVDDGRARGMACVD